MFSGVEKVPPDPVFFVSQQYKECTAEVKMNLGVGAYGGDVHCLQSFLARRGYLLEEPTGYFGERTANATKRWQVRVSRREFPREFPTVRGARSKRPSSSSRARRERLPGRAVASRADVKSLSSLDSPGAAARRLSSFRVVCTPRPRAPPPQRHRRGRTERLGPRA